MSRSTRHKPHVFIPFLSLSLQYTPQSALTRHVPHRERPNNAEKYACELPAESEGTHHVNSGSPHRLQDKRTVFSNSRDVLRLNAHDPVASTLRDQATTAAHLDTNNQSHPETGVLLHAMLHTSSEILLAPTINMCGICASSQQDRQTLSSPHVPIFPQTECLKLFFGVGVYKIGR